jgi:hypothetical protein
VAGNLKTVSKFRQEIQVPLEEKKNDINQITRGVQEKNDHATKDPESIRVSDRRFIIWHQI